MAEGGFWDEGDALLMKAWVKDLMKLGYRFPAVRKASQHHAPAVLPVDPKHPTPRHW
jgi:hypothetical protein